MGQTEDRLRLGHGCSSISSRHIYGRPPPSTTVNRQPSSWSRAANRIYGRARICGSRWCPLAQSRELASKRNSANFVHSDGGPPRANLGTGSCRSRFSPNHGNHAFFDNRDSASIQAGWAPVSAFEFKAAFVAISLHVAEVTKAVVDLQQAPYDNTQFFRSPTVQFRCLLSAAQPGRQLRTPVTPIGV